MASVRRPSVIETEPLGQPCRTFDLYFVRYPQDGDWAGVMQRIAREAGRPQFLGEEDNALWERLVARVLPWLPKSEIESNGAIHELTHADSGIQFCCVPAATVLTVPYWYVGPEAERVVGLLRRIAVAVEAETGLIAYDPQAEAPFLAYGAGSAVATFEQHHDPAMAAGRGKIPSARKRWRRR